LTYGADSGNDTHGLMAGDQRELGQELALIDMLNNMRVSHIGPIIGVGSIYDLQGLPIV